MINTIRQKGQIVLNVTTGIALISAIVAPIASYYKGQADLDKKIVEVKQEATANAAALSERTVKLETIVPVINTNMSEIKDDVKDLKKAFNVK